MGRAQFDQEGFVAAARALIAERGPQAVTVDSVAERLKAPKGSFYYRFASRDALLGEVWLNTVLAYQEGFVAAIEAGDGLKAALHTPAWARRHLDDARLLMLYSRHDFIQGDVAGAAQAWRRRARLRASRVACGRSHAPPLAASVARICGARHSSWRKFRSPPSSHTSCVASGRRSWSMS